MSLAEKRKQYPEMPRLEYLPAWSNVIVYQLDAEQKTAGGLHIPDTAKTVQSRGILMAAGLAAMDKLADALIEIGDEVFLGRFAGDNRETKTQKEGKGTQTLWELVVDDIKGSAEALTRVEEYYIDLAEDEDGRNYHKYVPKKGRAA